MSIGSALLGLAVVLVVAAYLARPFRTVPTGTDLDRLVDTWVAQSRAREDVTEARDLAEGTGGVLLGEEDVFYCPQCGRRAAPDHQFCSGCGTRLRGETE